MAALQRQLDRLHPNVSGLFTGRAEYQVEGGQKHVGQVNVCLAGRALRRPNRTLERMKQLEAEAVLLTRPLYELTRVENYGADPLARLDLVALEQLHDARLEYAVELDPVLEAAAYFEPVGEQNNALVSHYGQYIVRDLLLLHQVVLFLLLLISHI